MVKAKNTKQASCSVASKAAKVLRNPNSTKTQKTIAASTLSQTRKKCN